ncbi:MAG: translocation/assembly module TamB domain-containing protein [Deferribacterales bacterium]
MLFVIVNFLIKENFNSILSNYSKYKIEVGEVKSLFIPFYIELSNLHAEIDYAHFNADTVNLKLSIFDYFKGRPYISIDITNFKGDIPESFFDTTADVNFDKLIKKLIINNINLSLKYKGVKIDGKANSLNYSAGDFTIPYLNGFIKKGEIEEKFLGSIKLKFIKDLMRIDDINIKGEDFFIEFFNGFSKGKESGYKSEVKGFIGNRLIKIFNEDLDGRVILKGGVDNFIISLILQCHLTYDNRDKYDFVVHLNGDIKNRIKYKTDGLSYKKEVVDIYGEYDVKENFVKGGILNKEGIKVKFSDDWNLLINNVNYGYFLNGIGGINATVVSNEKYLLNLDFIYDKKSETLKFDKVNLISGGTKVQLDGFYDFEKFELNYKGVMSGNKDIQKVLGTSFQANTSGKILLEKDNFTIVGEYASDTVQKLYGIMSKRLSGTYHIDNKKIEFVTNADLQKGLLNVKGEIWYNDKKERYDLTLIQVPFYEVMNYFDSTTDIKYPIDGFCQIFREGDDYYGNGNFSVSDIPIKENSIKISFKNSYMYVEEIKIDDNIFKKPLKFDFHKGLIKGEFKIDRFRYKQIPDLNKFIMKIDGEIKNPSYKGSFTISYKDIIKNRKINFEGDLEQLRFYHSYNDLKIKGVLDQFERININAEFLGFTYDNISASGSINISSNDLTNYILYGGVIDLFNNKELFATLKNVKFELNDVKKVTGDFWLDSLYLKAIKVSVHSLDEKLVKGEIDLNNAKGYNNDYLAVKDIQGVLKFEYNYKDYPLLHGAISSLCDLNYKDYRVRLLGNKVSAVFNGGKVSVDIDSKYIKAAIRSYAYYDKRGFIGNGSFKDVFISKGGFYGVFSGNLRYGADGVKGEIFLDDSFLNINRFRNEFTEKKEDSKLPFFVDLKIYSRKPIVITDKLLEGKLNLSLSVKGKDNLTVSGKVELREGFFYLEDIKFIIKRGNLNILNENSIYIDMEAVGTGSLENTRIIAQGYFPNYKIYIYDKKLRGYSGVDSKRTGGETLLGELISRGLFRNIVNITNNLLGINRVGFEPTSNGGLFKIGKQFDERTGVSYVIDMSYTEKNKFIGEYKLFDWINISAFSTEKGGTGAGINFSIDF